jgi:hypothetical protein
MKFQSSPYRLLDKFERNYDRSVILHGAGYERAKSRIVLPTSKLSETLSSVAHYEI